MTLRMRNWEITAQMVTQWSSVYTVSSYTKIRRLSFNWVSENVFINSTCYFNRNYSK